ncbi:hypothetical protein AAZX31_03G117400 [Glycine max]|uniref:Rho termination factor-like N-terminal domain-containing protein n=2 Tax=Glycine subgen. Soja TaxID=1462606 RepID=K7KET6_SOYBN|nr:uncharacterized protein LOC114406690 isoform X3 [Glycine soja]XP_040869962.1 uncharacterized protein LOC102666817 isoform X3 [Glycine max]KAH1069817.1 hypothetical protein GYH30_007128 [Glycine max]KAH1069818.1 hypothetical protein GYH30_007128 [Glycine max]KRH66873.1 hypothetical protein GLYMA_03G133900v4 [Glycine max]KRH66874.1 hypothetical protein GLYMA_03G133900v4 [Glycine max]RZC20484.1 hypothetical protein D0Y65_007062 [Glycine soja]
MAWDLWSSSYAQVASGSNYWSQHPECDFYFGCGRDFIEEDALNVESCVRVLRILITKADTEIEELERDLLLLQNELACTEHEKWPDICCAALTERISRLDVAVSTLKNDYADDAEMQPLLDKEPAETLNEILAQSLDMNMLSPIVNVTGHALDKDSSTFDSNIIIKEEEKELHGTSESSELLLELHEKRSDNPEKIEKENEFVKENDVSLDDFRPAIGVKGRKEYPHSRLATSQQRKRGPDHSHWMKLSETSDNKVAGNEEVGRNQLINTDIGQILDLFSAKDNENIPSEVKKESEFVKEKDVSSDDFRPAIGVKGRKEYPHSRLATSQQQKSGPESPDHSDWMKLSETSDKVSGNEVERSQLIDTDIGQILDLFSAKDNENIPNEAKKENEFVKEDVSSDDFRPATDIKGRKKYPNSRLATSQRKSRNSNLDKKVCDFAPETAQRAYKKQSKVAPDEDLNSVDLPLQVVYPQTFCSADTEFCSFKGSNGIQTKSTLNTDLQMIDEDEEEQEAQDLKSQITSEFRKLNMSFPSKLKAREKQKLELEAFSSREPYDSCTEVIPSTPIIVSTKRQRRSKPCTDVAILNEPMNRKIITRRAVQPDKHETEGRALVPYDSNFSELQKRRKALKLPITVDMETNSDRVSMDSRSQLVLHSSNLHSLVDSHDGASSLLPGDLNSLSLIDLRAMAKDHKVKQYYKLRKGALVEQLAKQLSSC